ncbi:MAG: hypothetical protein QXO70_04495 [Candidatus Pacearchaeota archaeon]
MDLDSLTDFFKTKTENKTVRNLGRVVDLCIGAIKQLDDKITKLNEKIEKYGK